MTVSYASRTITRLRYGTVVDYGTTVLDPTSTPAQLAIAGCWYEPTETTVVHEGREAVLSGMRVVAPKGTELDPLTDHVRIDGDEYEISSDVQKIPSPTGALDEVRFSARRWRHAE